jgi:hypothetical protein
VDSVKKFADEQRVIEYMIYLYCKGKKHDRRGNRLCMQCEELARYTRERNERCPFMETRTFCQYCKVHCYRPEMRERISEAMRYAGPRMIYHRPIMAIKHLMEAQRQRRIQG